MPTITGFAMVGIALTALAFFIGCAIFQWLWNCTMPDQFGVKPLRYWVAFRLLLIAAFLFSGGLFRMNLNPPVSNPTVIAAPSQ